MEFAVMMLSDGKQGRWMVIAQMCRLCWLTLGAQSSADMPESSSASLSLSDPAAFFFFFGALACGYHQAHAISYQNTDCMGLFTTMHQCIRYTKHVT